MPRKKSDLTNGCSKHARRMRIKRAHESEEQIAARNAAQRIRTAKIRRQESQEQREERLRKNMLRTRATRKRHIATFRERERERQQTRRALKRASFVRLEFKYAPDIDYSARPKMAIDASEERFLEKGRNVVARNAMEQIFIVNQCSPDDVYFKEENGEYVKEEMHIKGEEYCGILSGYVKPAPNNTEIVNESDERHTVPIEFSLNHLRKDNVDFKKEIECDTYQAEYLKYSQGYSVGPNEMRKGEGYEMGSVEIPPNDLGTENQVDVKVKIEGTVEIEIDRCKEVSQEGVQEQVFNLVENSSDETKSVSQKNFPTDSEEELDCKVEIEETIKTEFDHDQGECQSPLQEQSEQHNGTMETVINDRIEEITKKRKRPPKEKLKCAASGSSNLKSYQRRPEGVPLYTCIVCQKQNKRSRDLKHHMFTHFEDADYVREFDFVEICNKLGVKNKIVAEIDGNEYNSEIFKCKLCDYKTLQSCDFNKHVKGKHLNEKEFKCDVCEFSTSYSCNLKDHQRIHNKMLMFKCDICLKDKTRAIYLKCHMFTHLQEAQFIAELDVVSVCEELGVKRSVIAEIKGRNYKIDIFKCNQCNYQASRCPVLSRHIKLVH